MRELNPNKIGEAIERKFESFKREFSDEKTSRS